MNSRLKNLLCVLLSGVLSALFILILSLAAPKIADVPEATGGLDYTYRQGTGPTATIEKVTLQIGTDLTAVRITDLNRLGRLTKVNYVANQFVYPEKFSSDMEIVDLTKPFPFAEKGTLLFVILNLNPQEEDFYEQSERLAEYKIGDNWVFSLSLPKIFCASNVYQKATLAARHGELANYDFIEFTTSYDKKTERFLPETENTELELHFYTRREAIMNSAVSAQTVTIHYQSSGTSYAGISECPLVGTEDALAEVRSSSQALLVAFAVLAGVVLAVFIVLSLLKRTTSFLPEIVWIFGIAVMLVARIFLGQSTIAPLFWASVSLGASFLVLVGAIFGVAENTRKFPVKYALSALMLVGALLAVLCPLVSFGATAVLRAICVAVKGAGTLALLALIGLAIFRDSDKTGGSRLLCTTVIAVSIAASLFLPQVFPAQLNAMFWMCAATTVLTFFGGFLVLRDTERANGYLTANLHLEVEQQVKDIRAVIGERDNLLRFVSHDMKKPLQSSEILLDTLLARERDEEQKKALAIVKSNTARVVANLSEIGSYARFNYIAEPSQVVDLYELCKALFSFHLPDCNANGIVLKNLAERHRRVFAKRQGLENAISNIIMNAVEHANCSTITLSVRTEKNTFVLDVTDDGKGIRSDLDVFQPYRSENKPETGGIGLFICKSIVESMNGTLSYKSEAGNTTFSVSLLKAR